MLLQVRGAAQSVHEHSDTRAGLEATGAENRVCEQSGNASCCLVGHGFVSDSDFAVNAQADFHVAWFDASERLGCTGQRAACKAHAHGEYTVGRALSRRMDIGADGTGAGEGTGDFVDQDGASDATTATETAFFERCTVIAHDGHFDMKAIGLGHFQCESKVQ
jgi:hypothetical protein